MTVAAKDVTGERETPRFVRREADGGGFTRLDAGADFEIRQAEAMLYILGLDLDHRWLALFDRNLSGGELELFRSDTNDLLGGPCRPDRGEGDCGNSQNKERLC